MIRPTTPADVGELVALTAATGMFKPLEVDTLREVFDDYFAVNRDHGHRCHVAAAGPGLVGFTYHAPTAMTDRTWSLYWIVVAAAEQGRGLGGILLRHVEDDIRGAGGRLLVVETSSLPHYEPTRRFYRKHGYAQPGSVADFYADGDDLVFFTKRL
jgi:ribosomal protein S18 acetylase RimI-like enzyme